MHPLVSMICAAIPGGSDSVRPEASVQRNMHQCLSITEVQRVIFREVYHQDRGLCALARLGRTCRAFSSTALDVLWERLDSFLPLIKCLPQDLWKIMGTRVTFERYMSLKDWEVFFRYSSRVQELSGPIKSPSSAPLSFDDDVIFALSTPPRYGPLIPHLKTLHWDRLNRKYAPLLYLLLTPSLASLSLSSATLRSPDASIPTSIGIMCPSLKSLRIATDKPGASYIDLDAQKVLSETVPHLHSLQSLICPVLDDTAIVHLSHLSSLSKLSVELQSHQLEEIKPHLAAPAFVSLQWLTLRVSTLSTLTSLLESMRFEPRGVGCVVESVCTPDALHLFFLALVNACRSEQLSRISLIMSTKRKHGTPDPHVSLSTFRSLLGFPHIEKFEFDGPYDVVLDDDAILAFAKHWPKLTSFTINKRSGWGIPSRVTSRGLLALISSCTALTNFALSVDLSGVDVEHPRLLGLHPGDGVTNDKCRTANFVTSTIKYPLTVAAFMSDVCPELETVTSAWNDSMLVTNVSYSKLDSYMTNWTEVGKLLPAFSVMRRQCMEWAEKRIEEGLASA